MGDRLLRLRDVVDEVALHPATIYRRMKRGTFPQPRRFETSVRWPESAIEAWKNGQPIDASP